MRKSSRWIHVSSVVVAAAAVLNPATECAAQPAAHASPSRPAAAATTPLAPEQLERIRSTIKAAMDEHGIPGVGAAVGVDGTLAWSDGFGMADVENQVPVTSETVFRLASISKPVTAVAALKLVEAGKLNLDAPIQEYVPEFPSKQAPITTRQLLGHLGGIRHYRGTAEMDSTRRYADPVEAIRQFSKDDLEAPPGHKYEYSTFGFVLAGAVVQRAAGEPFMGFVEQCLNSGGTKIRIIADDARRIIPGRARGYARTADGVLENCRLADTSNKVPGGGMCSRPRDLVEFALALSRGEILSPSSLDLMWTPGRTSDGNETEYGLGWAVAVRDGRTFVAHSGGQQGTSTCLVLWPEQRAAAAVMCNLERVPAEELATRIADLLVTSDASASSP
ncbi:MAG: lipoprotein [Phycisphaerae bacterium]